MNISLFGGAFDPPHLGHQQVIKHLLTNGLADQVWLVPTGVHDFDKQMSPAADRTTMLKLLKQYLDDEYKWGEQVKLELCELNRAGVSQTYDTLIQLKEQHPSHDFTWVIGSDNLGKFHLWQHYDSILSEFGVYVYPRPGFEMKPIYQGMMSLNPADKIQAASTEIRQAVKQGGDWQQAVIPEIAEYIKENRLYL